MENLKKTSETEQEAIKRLADIIRLLRKECPWDKEQTHLSLKICMIEEAYEVCHAIDENNDDNLREELGDVMLQAVFHSVMAEEKDKFTLTDVINEECEKMIRRHPHIFSENNGETVDKVLEKWENIKREEHSYNTYTEELNSVPNNLPSLMRSYKVQKKAANIGFDWPDVKGALEKLKEEINEFEEALFEDNKEHMFEELGDLLFSVVNVSRFIGINPEMALNASIEKFIKRFEGIEQKAISKEVDLKDLTLEEMDLLWDEVKRDG